MAGSIPAHGPPGHFFTQDPSNEGFSSGGGADTQTWTLEVRKKDGDSPGPGGVGALVALGWAVVLFRKKYR